ncbi:MAG: response regulator [Vulcanimicrobiota bacterium]
MASGSPKRLLVVDDEAPVAQVLGRMLVRLGFEAEVFTHPVEAVHAFLADPGRFDLLITDQDMPHLKGFELVGQLRSVRPDLPVLVATAGSLHSSLQGEPFLAKPYSMSALADMLERLLGE